MKVVVTGTRGIPGIMGGVETHCEELFPRVAALGEDVTIARRTSYVTDSLSEWKGVRLVDLPSPRKKSFEAIVHTFRSINYAAGIGADVIHINAIGPALLIPYAKLRGLKVVFTHHGPDYDRDKWGRIAKTMLRFGERFGCKYADEVIVISKVIEDLIAAKYGRTDHVHLIPNGVSSPCICNFPEYFEALGIASGKFILGISRFVPEKKLEDLIRAFVKSGLGSKGYKLVLAGDSDFEDSYSNRLKSEAVTAGVVLPGFVKGRKLYSLLSNAALYVLPSSHEGLPIALLEAMSYNLPALVSDIPANLEVGLPEDNYYKLGDVEMLSSKILESVGRGRVEYDMEKYDWDVIASRTDQIYKSLCD